MRIKQLSAFANDAGQAAALVSQYIVSTELQLLTFILGSEVILGARCDCMALCTLRRDLHPRDLLRRPFSYLTELCIIPSFCGMYDWSLHYTSLAPRYTWRPTDKANSQLD